jgi:copper chaperone NosL
MINHLKEEKDSDIALYLVNDFSNPGDLVDARAATFLISENIPSPMGAYLSAFKDREAAENVRQANEGVLLNWEELLDRFSK